jgi:glycosyltransferase involved in cell wall biosynthesis
VVASGLRRGAEIFASDLIRVLDDARVSQRVAVLRDSEMGVSFAAGVDALSADGEKGHHRMVAGVDPHAVRGLRQLVASWRPDVVQAHGGEPLKYAVMAGVAGSSPPIVYRRIGSAPREIERGPRRAAYGWLMRRAARVIAVAEVLNREVVRTFRVPAGRVVTIPNGVDPSRVQPVRGGESTLRELGLADRGPVMLSLGALVWEKDPMTQLDVAARVVRERPGAVLLMAGDGPLRAQVETGIAERGLQGRVVMLGARDDVADLLAASDLLLFTSMSEGMPAVVIEAGMAGVPVAAFAVGGIPEVIEGGVTGVLASPGDVDGLAAEALALLEDPERRAAMGLAASESCARFDIREIGERYLDVYGSLVGSR